MTRKAVSRVLELKGFAREQHEAEVAHARRRLLREEEKLRDLERQYRASNDEFQGGHERGGLALAEVELFCAYLRHLTRQIQLQKAVVSSCMTETAIKEQAMLEAYKEEKIVEVLHEKLLLAEIRETSQGEQKEADEHFLARRRVK
jgi:flagellar export protein FliJ